MQRWLVAGVLVCGVVASLPQAAAQSAGAARQDAAIQVAREMQEATSLRLHGQRLAKLYRQAGMGVHAAQAQAALTKGVIQGEQALARLARQGQQPAGARVYGRCVAVWQELRAVVTQPYTSASAERAGQLAEALAIHAGKLAMQIEAGADSPVGRALDGAARLNMFAQRLARLYFQSIGGDRSQGLLTDMAQTRSEFATGLLELERYPGNPPAAREALALVRNQWIFLDEAVRLAQGRSGSGREPQHVATSSERIQETLASLAEIYRELLQAGSRGM